MALASIDDKILGEKVNNYCSSSEDESQDSGEESNSNKQGLIKEPTFNSASKKNGRTTQTGPKGVIEDCRRYKQLQTEKREWDLAEKQELHQKLAMTCQSFREEQEEKEKSENDDQLNLSDDDDYMEWFKQKRYLELQQKYAAQWDIVAFGDVHELTRNSFVEATEHKEKYVSIIHIYDNTTPACVTVNGCMQVLAQKYKAIKFCRINVTEAGMSSNFIENGLPAILVYKDNVLTGNFVRVSDTLGNDFFAPEFEAFLLEYGMLPSSHEFLQGNS